MQARIYQRVKSTMQSGRDTVGQWRLEYAQGTRRYPEPLMGWTASGDTLNQVTLEFNTLDDAKAFADKNGMTYEIDPVHPHHVQPRTYLDNFRDKSHLQK
jgi:hypothetical protein